MTDKKIEEIEKIRVVLDIKTIGMITKILIEEVVQKCGHDADINAVLYLLSDNPVFITETGQPATDDQAKEYLENM